MVVELMVQAPFDQDPNNNTITIEKAGSIRGDV
jgi:hypothetical protein